MGSQDSGGGVEAIKLICDLPRGRGATSESSEGAVDVSETKSLKKKNKPT